MKTLLSNTARSNLFTMGVTSEIRPEQAVPAKLYKIPAGAVRLLRARLILEEAIETIEALGVQVTLKGSDFPIMLEGKPIGEKFNFVDQGEEAVDLEEVIDGCCDTNYVCVGTLVAFGVPDEPHQMHVNTCNDNKFPNAVAIADENGKFQKPEKWVPPDHRAIANMVRVRLSASENLSTFSAELIRKVRSC